MPEVSSCFFHPYLVKIDNPLVRCVYSSGRGGFCTIALSRFRIIVVVNGEATRPAAKRLVSGFQSLVVAFCSRRKSCLWWLSSLPLILATATWTVLCICPLLVDTVCSGVWCRTSTVTAPLPSNGSLMEGLHYTHCSEGQ